MIVAARSPSVECPAEWCVRSFRTPQLRHHLEPLSDSNASIRPAVELKVPFPYRHDRHGLPVAAVLLRKPAVAQQQDAEVYFSRALRQYRLRWSQPEQIGLNSCPKQPTRDL